MHVTGTWHAAAVGKTKLSHYHSISSPSHIHIYSFPARLFHELLAHREDALQAVGLLAEEVVLARHMPRADAQRINISTCTAQMLAT